ncbi:MarR family winged helix-turn-helix transcriptional regulator [Sphingomonas sp. HMP6]|uniref:MarR family winged helix-turn-helix transcriptional regulator n=1 Tax=Sphingomonas sp. HMP6 TaxID=1517551 RepID=UPI001596C7BC|nr:MarR family winged helix-turn-helix transcriptional regulator [Sphingomonas sp. HMP6]BCA58013.1 MarR family transcriptional regulator [Sphingomonas sp. HMP6]
MPELKLDHFLPYRLSIASNRVSAAIASTYQALFGLKIPEWRLIAVIAEGAGATQQALGVATRMDKVTVSRAAATLVERGLVERRPNPGDQRSHLLVLTATGRALYEDVAPKALELEAEVFAGFTPTEIATFAAMLERIEASAAPFDSER